LFAGVSKYIIQGIILCMLSYYLLQHDSTNVHLFQTYKTLDEEQYHSQHIQIYTGIGYLIHLS
jgi:hypothetical protein